MAALDHVSILRPISHGREEGPVGLTPCEMRQRPNNMPQGISSQRSNVSCLTSQLAGSSPGTIRQTKLSSLRLLSAARSLSRRWGSAQTRLGEAKAGGSREEARANGVGEANISNLGASSLGSKGEEGRGLTPGFRAGAL